MKREKKLALWVVSNCKALRGSKIRMKYSNEMVAAGMQIDRYGNCFGNRREYDRLQQENLPFYKFYLSFENAEHCKDYITEKFWARGILDGRVPVVWGPSKADVTRLAPPGSFIHADDFKSPAKLAKYLMVLDKNDTAYREYFAWVEKPSGAWKERLLKLYSKTREELLCDIVMEHKINKVIPSIYDDLYKDEAKSCLAA
uniref:alpha-(1,3)-fucosyltransferase 6-like n=1 Tax=Ciona intestinalis TaxID=7719 RepID=UPI000EF52B62|nr:alpha-(1,3)-fucosyltransferase 6-like [Ciona intestinalis]|eukprot:XP_026689630.1 alpha-(1,3)-fucosyltransferase 6-like [Ciona intestinalis]